MLNIKLKSKHDLSQNAGIVPHEMTFLDASKLYEVTPDGYLKTNANLKLFIPKMTEEMFNNYEREATSVSTFGVMPAKFYDKDGNVALSTLMTIPSLMHFNVYSEIQETPDEYILTYEPNSKIVDIAVRKSVANVEYFINQIYLLNKQPIIPYHLLTELMFRCMDINEIDLNGPTITFEFLARRLCRTESGDDTFAKVYGRNPNVDPHSYKKFWYREAVQNEGVLQGILFQDISKSLNVGLAATLNGKESVQSPLEKIIKA
jgi:hypothetical protein